MVMRRNPQTGLIEDDGTDATGGPRDPNGYRPTDVGGMKRTNAPLVNAETQGGGAPNTTQRKGYQPPKRTAPTGWGGGTATVPPPPPPIAAPRPAPNFGSALSGLSPVTRGQGYTSTTKVAPAQMGPKYATAEKSWQGEELLPDLNQFARSWMGSYNPLSSEYGTTARAAMEANLRKREQDQIGGIEEWASSRGLVGSSYEGDQRVALNEAQQRARLEEELAIMDMLAQYELQGRSAAGNFGLQTGAFGQSLGNDRRDEGQFQWTADRTTSRDFEDDTRFRAGFEEDAARYGYESDYRAGRDFEGDQIQRAGLSLDAMGMQSDADLDQYLADMEAKRFAETGIMDRARLAGENDDRSLRAWDSNEDRVQDGQRMDQDDAQFGANNEYQWGALDQNDRQYGRTQTETERANRERERIAETAALAELLESGIGDEGITPEMAKIIKERTGFDIPVTPKKAAAGDPTNPVVGGLYDERPKTLPPGKTKKDGYYTRDRVTGKYTWKDDRQDSWNPADWWQGEK